MPSSSRRPSCSPSFGGCAYRSLVFHEWGVSKRTWGRRRALLSSEIESFYCDGNVRFDFIPPPGSALRSTRFRSCVRKFDLDLTSFVEHLSKIIMRRMARNLPTEPVQWTARIRFLPRGLEYDARGLLGSSLPIVVPYHLTSYRIVGRHFFLHIAGRRGRPSHSRSTPRERRPIGLSKNASRRAIAGMTKPPERG